MKYQSKKWATIIVLTVVLTLMGICCGCGKTENTNIQNTEGLTTAESSKMTDNAESFYQAVYSKDFDSMTALMTDSYASALKSTRDSGTDENRNDGTLYLLNLDELTSVQTPEEINSPIASAGDIDYSVKLILNDIQSAYVCFSKTENGYKVCRFDFKTTADADAGQKGGYMGSGYQE